jgi:hypothetical protein
LIAILVDDDTQYQSRHKITYSVVRVVYFVNNSSCSTCIRPGMMFCPEGGVHVLSWTHEGRRWLNESNLADCATLVNSYILIALISRPRRWLCRKIGVLLVFVLLLLIASFGCTYVDTRCFPRRGTSNESIRYAGRWNERLRKWTSDTQILLTHKDTRRPGVEIESHGESSHDFVESHILNSKEPQDHSH